MIILKMKDRVLEQTHSESTALIQVFGKEKLGDDENPQKVIYFFQEVLQCGGKTLRYHKIIAKCDAEHIAVIQSQQRCMSGEMTRQHKLPSHNSFSGAVLPTMGEENTRLLEKMGQTDHY
jgi:hypothetical protein